MTLPTYVSTGATANSANAVAVGLPASIATDDILLLLIETANQAITVSNQAGGTWTEVTNSPQGTGTAAGLTATRLTVFWSRYNGTQTAPTISDSGDHQIAAIYAFRGCKTTGDPYNISSGNVDATSDTSLSATGASTTAADCLVCICATLMDDAQNFGATWTNADLANITVRTNFSGIAGNDGRGILITGEKAAAGAYTATTNTLTANSVKGLMTIALEGLSSSQVTNTWNLRHDLSSAVEQIWNLRHDMAGSVSNTWNLRHDLLTSVEQIWNLRHDLSQTVSNTWNLRHDLAAQVEEVWNLRHDLASKIENIWNLRHDLLSFVSQLWTFRHDLLADEVEPPTVVENPVRGFKTANRPKFWQPLEKELTVKFRIPLFWIKKYNIKLDLPVWYDVIYEKRLITYHIKEENIKITTILVQNIKAKLTTFIESVSNITLKPDYRLEKIKNLTKLSSILRESSPND